MLFKHLPTAGLPMWATDGDGSGGSGDGEGDDPPGGGGDGKDGGEGGDTLAEIKAALKAERDAHKTTKRDISGLRTKLTEFEAAGKTELEKVTGERDALTERVTKAEARARDAAGRVAVETAAKAANAINARAVYALARDQLAYDDETGEPSNVDEVIKSLKKSDADLFPAIDGSGDGGKHGDDASGSDMNALLRRQLKGPR